jgi:hypothetical protein
VTEKRNAESQLAVAAAGRIMKNPGRLTSGPSIVGRKFSQVSSP